jgi:D-arabinose 1-dehydrogenase-like Zn-dependent alcohol dehydrogenase
LKEISHFFNGLSSAIKPSKMPGEAVFLHIIFENCLGFARLNDLSETIKCEKDSLVKAFLAYTGGEHTNGVIEVTGEQKPLRLALELVRLYGMVHAQGMYLEVAPPDMLRQLFGKNLTLSCTVGEMPELTQETLAMMAEGKLTTQGLITSVSEPTQADEVYTSKETEPNREPSDAELLEKFRWLAATRFSEPEIQALESTLWNCAELPDCQELVKLMQ